MNDLRKIHEGMTGAEAAQVIYHNDKDLLEKVEACEDALDAYKAYANQLVVSGSVTAQVVQYAGDRADAVMSQAAVTNIFNDINDDAYPLISDMEITDDTADTPGVPVVNATYAIHAAYDTEGHPITDNFYNIQALDVRIRRLEDLVDDIELLKARMNAAEANIAQIQEWIINHS